MSGSDLNHSSDVVSPFSNTDIHGTLGSPKPASLGSKNITSMNRINKTTAPSPSGPIIAANCISCMGMVRIPHSLPVNTTVRCPHCQELFVLSELLDQSLPSVEIVVSEAEAAEQEDAPYIDTLHLKRDEQANREERPRVKFEIPKALKDGAKRKRRRKRRSRSASGEGSSSTKNGRSYVIPDSVPTDGDSTTMGEAIERRQSRSGSRRSSSGSSSEGSSSSSSYRGKVRSHASRLKDSKPEWSTEDLFKIVAGSLLAIPIAYMMLIWVFKSDPFGVASPVSRVLPFAIPSSMHASDEPAVRAQPPADLPKYLEEDSELKPFVPEPITEGDDRIAVPNIDPDEVFGQEFGL